MEAEQILFLPSSLKTLSDVDIRGPYKTLENVVLCVLAGVKKPKTVI